MGRTRRGSSEHLIGKRVWGGSASAIGLLLTGLLLASCGSAGEPSADASSGSQAAQGALAYAEPDTSCGAAPTSLAAEMAIDIERTDCLYTAPVTLTAQVPGKINFLISPPPVECAVEVLNKVGSPNSSFSLDSSKTVDESQMWSPGATSKSLAGFIIGPDAGPDDRYGAWALDTGEAMSLSDKDGGTCRFQVSWTPSAAETPASTTTTTMPATTTTTTTAPPTTTSTTTTTTTTAPPTTTTTSTTTTPPTTTPPTTTTSNVGS